MNAQPWMMSPFMPTPSPYYPFPNFYQNYNPMQLQSMMMLSSSVGNSLPSTESSVSSPSNPASVDSTPIHSPVGIPSNAFTINFGLENYLRGGMSMDDQEKKKLERKRARNRQAASKCRQKKMDRIKELEDQVSLEKHRGQRLDAELVELNRALDNFRRMVERHSVNGCPNSMRV